MIVMMILAPIAAALIQMAISRTREFSADAASAHYTGNPNELISALGKLEAYSKRIPMDASPATAHMFIIQPFSGQSFMRLFSTHPSTEARIARLREQMAIRPMNEGAGSDHRKGGPESRVDLSGHPWVFSSDVRTAAAPLPRRRGQGGAIRAAGRSGTAHYSSTSEITLRLLSHQVETIDRAFFPGRLRKRRRTVSPSSPTARPIAWCTAEGDRLPALIVDRYKDWLVVQTLDQGMDARRRISLDA